MLSNNPKIASAHHRTEVSREERRAAEGARLPQVNLAGGYAYMNENIALNANRLKQEFSSAANSAITSGVEAGIISPSAASYLQGLGTSLQGIEWSYTLQKRSVGVLGAEATLPLFLGGKINAAIRAAKDTERLTSIQYDATTNFLISELITLYYGLQLAERVVRVREEVTRSIARHLSDAIAMEQQGTIARSQRLYIEYQMAEAEGDLHDAQQAAASTRKALQNTLFTDVKYNPASEMFILEELEDVEYYKTLAYRNNTSLSQLSLQQDLALQAMRVQRSEFFPQVVATAATSLLRHNLTPLAPRWVVGIGVSMKLFDGLARERSYAAAKSRLSEVEDLARSAHAEVDTAVESIYSTLLSSRNRIHSIEASLLFAEEYLLSQRAAFKAGLISSAELIDAELNLAKSRTELVEAAYRFDVALAQLLEVAGMSSDYTSYMQRNDAKIIN